MSDSFDNWQGVLCGEWDRKYSVERYVIARMLGGSHEVAENCMQE